MEIEIIKLGTIINNKTILIVNDGDSIFNHYIDILRKNYKGDCSFLKTTKEIIGGPFNFLPGKSNKKLIGELLESPVVGKSFSLGSWYSSSVEEIIEEDIIITKNSVYALYNQSKLRNNKLENLGI
jgi:hypothetical protein